MNIWLRGGVEQNPYDRTAFRIARVPREIVRHKTMVQMIGQTRRITRADGAAHTIKNAPVNDADVNTAEKLLVDPLARMAEELLYHAAEKPPFEGIRQLKRHIDEEKQSHSEPLQPKNTQWLHFWSNAIIGQMLETAPAPDPLFGPVELSLHPPFCQSED